MRNTADLRRMTKIELVIYGRGSEPARRQAADELFRRYHDKYLKRGLLELTAEEAAVLGREIKPSAVDSR